MWKYPKNIEPNNVQVGEFKGLSRLPIINQGELQVSKNLVFDFYPVMSVRRGRTLVNQVEGKPQSFIAVNGKFAVVAGNKLFYDGVAAAGLSLTDGRKSLVEFWGKIFIFPDAKYYDIATATWGNIGTGAYPADGSCPEMDYVVVHNNRLWGCKGNHVYASALGNALGDRNPDFVPTEGNPKPPSDYGWTYFVEGGNPAESGSWAVDCAIDGDLQGICSWDNRIVCLGERNHLEIYGDYPSNFSMRSITKYGTISHSSILEVNSRLYYVANNGVLQYSGGVEREVSRNLNESYNAAVCGTDGIRYYLALNSGADKRLYVYHSLLDCWTEEDSLDIVDFATMAGFVYALCADGKIYKFNDPASTEKVAWRFEFDDYSPAIYNNTEVRSLKLKVKSTTNTYVNVDVAVDGRERETKKEITFPNNSLQRINIGVGRGSEHRFAVYGQGAIDIFGYQYTFTDGGDK